MKRLLSIILLGVAVLPCYGQTEILKPIYKDIQLSGGVQTTSATFFTYNGDRPFPTANGECGMLYMARLGVSKFYFETGAYLGLINMGFDYYHDGPRERVVSRHARLKIPVNFDYMLPMGSNLALLPSLGLGFTASYVTNISNNVVEDSDPGFGVIFPHVGLSMMTSHFMLGLSHDFFASIQSEVVLNGILQLHLAYLF